MPIDLCDFCNELSGGKDHAFARIYRQQPQSRTVFRSSNFAVIPSIGQIVEGHLLLVPINHYTAIADMPVGLILEAVALQTNIRTVLTKSYGSSVFFEHGIRNGEPGGCGIDHAHLHAVPLAASSDPVQLLKQQHAFKSINDISDISRQIPFNASYLFYEEITGQKWVFETDWIPSQYVRKLLAETVGNDSWNWRECGREKTLIQTIERLSNQFVSHAAWPHHHGLQLETNSSTTM